MLFVLRHGERADKTTPEEKSKVSIKCDPHLTKLGELQAKKAGKKIIEMLLDYHKPDSKPADFKYLILSSPFRRCIETAYQVSQELPKENILDGKIYLNDYLCDYLGEWHPENVLEFLQVRTDPEVLQQSIGLDLQDGFPEIGGHAYQPKHPEEKTCIRKRVSEGHSKIKPYYIKEINKENNVVLILVTHGFVVECILELYNGFEEEKKLEYTNLSQIIIDPNDLSGKVIYGQYTEHLKEAEEEYKTLSKS